MVRDSRIPLNSWSKIRAILRFVVRFWRTGLISQLGVAHGEGVSDWQLGKRVLVRASMRLNGFDSLENIWMASDFDGAFAQYVTLPAQEAQCSLAIL